MKEKKLKKVKKKQIKKSKPKFAISLVYECVLMCNLCTDKKIVFSHDEKKIKLKSKGNRDTEEPRKNRNTLKKNLKWNK